jgi:hypothetical protein
MPDQQPPPRRDPWAPPPQQPQDAVPPSPPAPVPPLTYGPPPPPPAPYDPYAPGYPGPGYPYPAWLPPAPRNGLGTAALVVGIVGAVAAVSCFGAVLGLPLGVLALVFGIVGRRRVRRAEATNGGQALAGIILGAVAVVISIVMVVLLVVLAENSHSAASRKASLTSDHGSSEDPLGPGGTATYDDGTQVTVSAATSFTPPDDSMGYTVGDDAYRLTVTVHNGGSAIVPLGEAAFHATAGDSLGQLEQIQTDSGELSEAFPGALPPEFTSHVVLAFDVPKGQRPLRFDLAPTFQHQEGNWQLDVG